MLIRQIENNNRILVTWKFALATNPEDSIRPWRRIHNHLIESLNTLLSDDSRIKDFISYSKPIEITNPKFKVIIFKTDSEFWKANDSRYWWYQSTVRDGYEIFLMKVSVPEIEDAQIEHNGYLLIDRSNYDRKTKTPTENPEVKTLQD
jgi:hypothetical protein